MRQRVPPQALLGVGVARHGAPEVRHHVLVAQVIGKLQVVQRHQQAAVVNAFVDEILARDRKANVIVDKGAFVEGVEPAGPLAKAPPQERGDGVQPRDARRRGDRREDGDGVSDVGRALLQEREGRGPREWRTDPIAFANLTGADGDARVPRALQRVLSRRRACAGSSRA